MSEPMRIGAGDFDDDLAFGLVGPEDSWYHARIKDWILLEPGIEHAVVRVYGVFAALVTKQTRFSKRVTKDQLRWLCPGVKGKPMGKSTFNEALRKLEEWGLIRVKAGSRSDSRVRNARTGRFEHHESFVFLVGDMPENPDAYVEGGGWRNVFDKLDAYPGPGWDKAPADRDQKTGRGSDQGKPGPDETKPTQPVDNSPGEGTRDQKTGRGSDQGKPGDGQNSGRDDASGDDSGQNSGHPNQISGRPNQNSGRDNAGTWENEGDQDSPPRQFSKTTPLPPTDSTGDSAGGTPARDEGEESPSGGTPEHWARAGKFLSTLLFDLGSDFAAPDHDQKLRLAHLVVQAWGRGASTTELRAKLSSGLHGVQYIGKVWIKRLETFNEDLSKRSRRTLPPVCGQCDARPGEGKSYRMVDGPNGLQKCPRCHPDAVDSAAA